jgi:hypothetical protein
MEAGPSEPASMNGAILPWRRGYSCTIATPTGWSERTVICVRASNQNASPARTPIRLRTPRFDTSTMPSERNVVTDGDDPVPSP